jgi:hypothetical protein
LVDIASLSLRCNRRTVLVVRELEDSHKIHRREITIRCVHVDVLSGLCCCSVLERLDEILDTSVESIATKVAATSGASRGMA